MHGEFTPARDADEIRDLLLHALRLLVVVQVPGVVAQLVDVRRDELRQAVVLLQVDREQGVRARSDLGQRLDVGLAVDRDAHQVGAGGLEQLHLPHRRRDVLREDDEALRPGSNGVDDARPDLRGNLRERSPI